MSKCLFLFRGLPGSGKTTLANKFDETVYTIAADDYFYHNGKYIFDKSKLANAHGWCLRECEYVMKIGHNIAIHNTLTTEKELEPYYALAEKYDYMVFSLIVENRHGNKSVHNVPDQTIQKMKNRFSVKL